MTSSVHGGICNMSHHFVGVGRVDIMSSIHEFVVLQNQVLIYSPNLRACARLPRQFPRDRRAMLFRPVISATPKSVSFCQVLYNGGARRCLSAVAKKSLRRSYLYGTLSFVSTPPSFLQGLICALGYYSPRIFGQDASKIFGNAVGRNNIRP